MTMSNELQSPLLAVLLVTSSSRGAALSFRYPRKPTLEKRYSRVKYLVASANDDGAAESSAGAANGKHATRNGLRDTTKPATISGLGRHLSGRSLSKGALYNATDEQDETRGWEQDEMDEMYDQSMSDASGESDDSSSDSSDSSVSEYAGAGDRDGPVMSPPTLEFSRRSSALDTHPSPHESQGAWTGEANDVSPQPQPPQSHEAASTVSGTAATRETSTFVNAEKKARRLRAYQQYIGYDCEILASMLAPKRELCHQKFELIIDDLAFVGHPVCVKKDGYWDPEAEQAQKLRGRGRERDAARPNDVQGYSIGDNGSTNESLHETTAAPTTLFHFVLVLDRPDPSHIMPSLDPSAWLQIFYDNVAFKMTAALFAEEVRCRYVSQEAERINALRDKCMDDGQSYKSFVRQAMLVSSLARTLQQVHTSIQQSSHAFVSINDTVDAHLQLPKMLQDPARMTHIQDVEAPVDINDPMFQRNGSAPLSADELLYEEWNRTTGPFLLPWKTLLLLHDDQDRTTHAFDGILDDQAMDPAGHGVESWAKRFTSLLVPTLDGIPTLADLADLLDWRLEEDVYPMVRHLIYYREARVVDVPRIQNYYSVSPLFDLSHLAKLSLSWESRFPLLQPLPSFLASLSSSLRPFSTLISRRDQRQLCLDVLIWLLRREVIVQMHVRLRLVANEECQRRAAQARKLAREHIEEKRRQRDAKEQRKLAAQGRSIRKQDEDDNRQEAEPRSLAPSHTGEENGEGRAIISSGLTATRPDEVGEAKSSPLGIRQGALSVSQSPASQRPATPLRDGRSRTSGSGGLVFERRRVLRSRSPSTVLAGTGPVATSVGTRGSTSPKLAVYPQSRARAASHTRGSEGTNSSGPVTSTRDGSTGSGQVRPLASSMQQPHDASLISNTQSQREGRSAAGSSNRSDQRQRSPSRPRMRVTGFGAGEEVSFQSADEAVEATSTLGNPDNEAAGSDMDKTAGADEFRRLSLVRETTEEALLGTSKKQTTVEQTNEDGLQEGEEEDGERTKEGHHLPLYKSDDGDDDNEGDEEEEEEEDDNDDDDDDVLLERSIEVEGWELQPVERLIAEPSRASGEENEWIAAMADGKESWLAERLYKLLPFLNGKHTSDEIVYRLEWRRKELRSVLTAFSSEILTLVHP